MTADPAQEFQKVLAALGSFGLLMVSDNAFPSVSGLVVRERVKGSWWSHPLAHTIFGINELLEEHRDVLITKLVAGKVTFVHRKLWPQIYAIGTAGEDWQMKGLSPAAKALFEKAQKKGSVDTSKLGAVHGMKPGDAARELELRLLIHAEQVHTELGAHAKIVETWDAWADRVALKDRGTDSKAAKQLLENRVKELNKKFGARAQLPWPSVALR